MHVQHHERPNEKLKAIKGIPPISLIRDMGLFHPKTGYDAVRLTLYTQYDVEKRGAGEFECHHGNFLRS